jgi:hypothetical protein
VSFFDEDDEPRTRVRPRRATAESGGAAPDRQAVLVRQLILFGGLALLLIIAVIGVRSCQGSQKRNALKDYNQSVAELVSESDRQVSKPFFDLLRDRGTQNAGDIYNQIIGVRNQAQTQYAQAQRIDTPDEMQAAQRSFLITMEFRRDGLASIADRIRTALSDDAQASEKAIADIAGAMQMFLASDVVHKARVMKLIDAALTKNNVGGQRIQTSQFLPGIQWLQPATIAARLGASGAGGGTGTSTDGTPAPGLHGTGLNSVSINGVRLQPNAANRIPLSGSQTNVAVVFTNQGENDETNIRVTVRVGSIRGTRTVASVARGATATATVTLPRNPPVGTPQTITVEVAPVPAETKTDNNRGTYDAIFSAG